MRKAELVCTRCEKSYPIVQVYPRCDVCGEPLEVRAAASGPIAKGDAQRQTILERYAAFFPFSQLDVGLSLGEGFTPLTTAAGLAAEFGIKKLLFKNESVNPTWSFKDRGTVTGVQHAASLGYRRIGTVSTGNMAVSVAAYGARAGLETFILITESLITEKVAPIAIYHPVLIKVAGDYARLYSESLSLGQKHDIYFVNSDVPFRVEGSKTIAFEICEQMEFDVPDYVIVPTSSGGNLRGILKGFVEFKQAGLISKLPIIVCAQASGCAPICNAFSGNREMISRVAQPHTIAHAIENPEPPSGNEVLRQLRKHNGSCIAVTDDEIIEAQRLLAGAGIFAQPDSAVSLAAARKLRAQKILNRDSTVACIITGGGLKDPSAFQYHNLQLIECKLEDLDKTVAEAVG